MLGMICMFSSFVWLMMVISHKTNVYSMKHEMLWKGTTLIEAHGILLLASFKYDEFIYYYLILYVYNF